MYMCITQTQHSAALPVGLWGANQGNHGVSQAVSNDGDVIMSILVGINKCGIFCENDKISLFFTIILYLW